MRAFNIIPLVFAGYHTESELISIVKNLKDCGRTLSPHIFFDSMPTDKLRYELDKYSYFFYEIGSGIFEPSMAEVRERFPVKDTDYLIKIDSPEFTIKEETIDLQDSVDVCVMTTITQPNKTTTLSFINGKLTETHSSC